MPPTWAVRRVVAARPSVPAPCVLNLTSVHVGPRRLAHDAQRSSALRSPKRGGTQGPPHGSSRDRAGGRRQKWRPIEEEPQGGGSCPPAFRSSVALVPLDQQPGRRNHVTNRDARLGQELRGLAR